MTGAYAYGSTAPHCKHVLVTGKFCAADASTPARREHYKISTPRRSAQYQNEFVAKEIPAGSTDPWLKALAFHLLRKHAATEGDAALESDSGKIGATAALRFCPGTH